MTQYYHDDHIIQGGTIDGTPIGQDTPDKGAFTELEASTDPADENGVGDRGFNDARYQAAATMIPPAPVAFAGSAGRTITHNYGHTDYQLIINPVADPGGFLGEIWISKAANTAVVYNSGSATGNFDYVIIPAA